jgi:SMI1 / KNR4 family (SUKH-1)
MKSSDRLFDQFKGNPPTTSEQLEKFEAASGIRLRDDYVAFLLQSNGGEGFIGEGYAMLWSLEELLEKNAGYNVTEFAPGLFLFGSDGGGEAFAFDNRFNERPIVSVPFIPLTLEDVVPVANDFNDFITKLAAGDVPPIS